MIIWVIIRWWFELLFDDYLMIIWLRLFVLVCDYLRNNYLWYLMIIWYWLFVIIRWLFDPNHWWLFDDYLPFCCSGASRSPQVGWMRYAPAGPSAACCRYHLLQESLSFWACIYCEQQAIREPWSDGESETKSLEGLGVGTCHGASFAAGWSTCQWSQAMNANQRLGRTLHSGLLPKACCGSKFK